MSRVTGLRMLKIRRQEKILAQFCTILPNDYLELNIRIGCASLPLLAFPGYFTKVSCGQIPLAQYVYKNINSDDNKSKSNNDNNNNNENKYK